MHAPTNINEYVRPEEVPKEEGLSRNKIQGCGQSAFCVNVDRVYFG